MPPPDTPNRRPSYDIVLDNVGDTALLTTFIIYTNRYTRKYGIDGTSDANLGVTKMKCDSKYNHKKSGKRALTCLLSCLAVLSLMTVVLIVVDVSDDTTGSAGYSFSEPDFDRAM
jgi:hypothetical protein